MIDWEEPESSKEAPVAPRSEAKGQADVLPPSAMSANAVVHWKRNLERFAPGHIGHEYAKQALAALQRTKLEIDTQEPQS